MQFRYQQLKSCLISGLCIACLLPGSKRTLQFKAGWLTQSVFLCVILETARWGREGGGKEAEVEKGRVVAHLVFISFPCLLIVQAKGLFQLEAMTLLLWYFILEEDRPQPALCAGILGAPTTALLWGGEAGGAASRPCLVSIAAEMSLKRACALSFA